MFLPIVSNKRTYFRIKRYRFSALLRSMADIAEVGLRYIRIQDNRENGREFQNIYPPRSCSFEKLCAPKTTAFDDFAYKIVIFRALV